MIDKRLEVISLLKKTLQQQKRDKLTFCNTEYRFVFLHRKTKYAAILTAVRLDENDNLEYYANILSTFISEKDVDDSSKNDLYEIVKIECNKFN